MSELLIYTQGDRQHGMGHVVRCLTLAEALETFGVRSAFITSYDTPGSVRIRQADYAMFDNIAEAGAPPFASILVDLEGGPTREFLEQVRPLFRQVIVVGGVGYGLSNGSVEPGLVDLQIYQTVLPVVPNGVSSLQGADWLIVNPKYAACQPDYERGHVVVTMGGGDPHELTGRAIGKLGNIGRPVKAVVGPASEGVLFDFIPPANAGLLPPLEWLGPAFQGASLTVCALGMTAYESLAAGVPVMLTNWTPDHERTAQELKRLGCGWNLGMWQDFEKVDLAEGARAALADVDDLRKMGMRGRKLVDGQGAGRVAGRIRELLNGA